MTYGGRRHRKVDSNCGDIVAILRGLGFEVENTNDLWDLTAQLRATGETVLCEVRPVGHAREPRSERQAKFQARFRVHWLQTADDCRLLRAMMLKRHTAIQAA